MLGLNELIVAIKSVAPGHAHSMAKQKKKKLNWKLLEILYLSPKRKI